MSNELLHVDQPECWCSPTVLMICPTCKAEDRLPTDPVCKRCKGWALVPHDGSDVDKLLRHRFLPDDKKFFPNGSPA